MTNVKCTTGIIVTGRSTTTFTWTIQRLKGFYVEEYFLDRVLSNEFHVKESDGRTTKWMLELLNNTDTSFSGGGEKYLKLLVHNLNADPIKTSLQVSLIGLINGLNAEMETVNHVKKIKENSSFELCKHTWKRLTEKGIFTFNGTLTIKCELTTFSSTISSDGPRASNSKSKVLSVLLAKNEKTFSESFSQFHLSKEMSDVQIKCEDQTFDSHQLILSARSPVFRAMFQAEMKEKDLKIVEIQDLKAKVIPEMLKYIYTGNCCVNDKKPDTEKVIELLEAGDKYQMDILKEMCETVLSGKLVLDNALQLLSLGDRHSAQDLKKNALDMIVTNAKKIIGTEEWKDCAENRPHLLIVVAEAMAASKK